MRLREVHDKGGGSRVRESVYINKSTYRIQLFSQVIVDSSKHIFVQQRLRAANRLTGRFSDLLWQWKPSDACFQTYLQMARTYDSINKTNVSMNLM